MLDETTPDETVRTSSLSYTPTSPMSQDYDPEKRWLSNDSQRTRASKSYLFCLTISSGGLQLVWTAIMSQGSPFLLSQGIPAHIVSLIWLAGPLCGLMVQPFVGTLSDQCRHPRGKRKPFIVFGTVATIFCLVGLPWSPDAVKWMFWQFRGNHYGTAASVLNGCMAASWIWGLNLAVQPVQSGLRALIVDCCPPEQQIEATAYASCAAGIGSILGYLAGLVPLPTIIPCLGDTQLKILCAITSFTLGSTVAITCFVTTEAKNQDSNMRSKTSFLNMFRDLLRALKTTSRVTRRVYMTQFCAWMGWFPFLFYITTYLGELYQVKLPESAINESINESSMRHATTAMVAFAAVAFISNMLFSIVTRSSQSTTGLRETGRHRFRRSRLPMWLNITAKTTLSKIWAGAQLFFAAVILLTSFIHDYTTTSILVGSLGIPWAVTQWVPWAIISTEIAGQSDRARESSSGSACELGQPMSDTVLASQAGTLIGLYNASIAAPQIIAALECSIGFWLLAQWEFSSEEAVGWVIRYGATAAALSAWLAIGIR